MHAQANKLTPPDSFIHVAAHNGADIRSTLQSLMRSNHQRCSFVYCSCCAVHSLYQLSARLLPLCSASNSVLRSSLLLQSNGWLLVTLPARPLAARPLAARRCHAVTAVVPVPSSGFLHAALLVSELLDDRTAVTLCVTCHSAHALLFHRYPIRRSFTQAELFELFSAARLLVHFETRQDSAEDDSDDETGDSAHGEPQGTVGDESSQCPTIAPCCPAWCAVSRGSGVSYDTQQSQQPQLDDIDKPSHDGYCVCCCLCCAPRWHTLDALNVFRHVRAVMIAHAALSLPALHPHTFPPGLRSLRLPGGYNSPITPGVLPASLRHLCSAHTINRYSRARCPPS